MASKKNVKTAVGKTTGKKAVKTSGKSEKAIKGEGARKKKPSSFDDDEEADLVH